MRARSFIAELRRRNVLRAAALYIGAVWALALGISQIGPSVGAQERFTRWFLVAADIGFLFAMYDPRLAIFMRKLGLPDPSTVPSSWTAPAIAKPTP